MALWQQTIGGAFNRLHIDHDEVFQLNALAAVTSSSISALCYSRTP